MLMVFSVLMSCNGTGCPKLGLLEFGESDMPQLPANFEPLWSLEVSFRDRFAYVLVDRKVSVCAPILIVS